MITLHEPGQFDLEAAGHGYEGKDDTARQSGASDGAGLVPENVEIINRGDGGGGGGGGGDGDGRVMHLVKVEKDCRICHLSLDVNSEEYGNYGIPIELGCCCKDDLAAAHKHCAEAWFKIKGNRTCEICGSTARNVAGANEVEPIDQWIDPSGSTGSQTTVPVETMATSDTHGLWQGHRFLNILLASMVFAFVISWLFHFNVPS